MIDYRYIHKFLLNKTKKYKFLNKIIRNNGIIKLTKPDKQFLLCIFWVIISQQISNKASEKIWSKVLKFIKKKGNNLQDLLSDQNNFRKLNQLGVSKKKLEYICGIATKMTKEDKDEDYYLNLGSKNFREEFQYFKGIGKWSCNMIEIFYFNRLDIWPEEDLIINQLSQNVQINESRKIDFAQEFKPYQSILALHFWKFSDSN